MITTCVCVCELQSSHTEDQSLRQDSLVVVDVGALKVGAVEEVMGQGIQESEELDTNPHRRRNYTCQR